MKKTVTILTIAFAASLVSQSAFAFCRAPGTAPQAPRSYDKPTQPSCMRNARYGEEADCDRRTLDNYAREVDRYVQRLEAYAQDAQRYARDAAEYANCEASEIRKTL